MDNSWHKFKQKDIETYPDHNGDYLVVCCKPAGNGIYSYCREVVYYSLGNYTLDTIRVRGVFKLDDAIVLYWKEIDWPEEFKS